MRYENTVSPIGKNWDQLPSLMTDHQQIRPYTEPASDFVLAGNALLQRALLRLLEMEGKELTITFDRRTEIAGDECTSTSQTTVIASMLLPFSWEELVARVSSERSEVRKPLTRNVFHFGDVRVDFLSMEVTRSSGTRINLTAQEFKMLRFFLLNPGRVISREELLYEAWGYENYPCTRTVDNHVLRLRQKLEIDPAEPVHFQTVIRVGYKFVPGTNDR